jgi:hypothetical protein
MAWYEEDKKKIEVMAREAVYNAGGNPDLVVTKDVIDFIFSCQCNSIAISTNMETGTIIIYNIKKER